MGLLRQSSINRPGLSSLRRFPGIKQVMFYIEVDSARAIVRTTMSGFMNVSEVAEFSRQEQQAVRDMGCASGEFLLLIDTEGAIIQSQEVVAAFMDIVANSPLKAKKIAVVRASSLTRMQTQRILMIRDNAAIFPTLAEAEDWLLADADADAPALQAARG
ncbi:hypothetical protein [Sphingomonas immobilis]|uniref:STAS/SEC14 domain-containing protein n=1 Tax=Sphingomonas immobilis TaxID=3063997 RepID=A0ABT9A4B7_9SPHN|nr:hypothetical protein [Sphingomonas sp. CA1-15]MDO7844691.1 hypothetical protein [Sphingomonas sp. CA1-15]